TTAETHVVALEGGRIRRFTIAPEDAGLPRAKAEDLKGGDPAHNARALRQALAGEHGAYRDIAVLNAAAALVVADKARDLREGAALAAAALDRGAAAEKLAQLVKVSNEAKG
ncbi:MAG TPA: anthranilate phosphoribosyltransferase, partial [Methylocystis sp.]|nr:anthranilate phosphoribosyltransferase [Methylocystis sp.]